MNARGLFLISVLFFFSNFLYASVCYKAIESPAGLHQVKWGCPNDSFYACSDQPGFCALNYEFQRDLCISPINDLTDSTSALPFLPENVIYPVCYNEYPQTSICEADGLIWTCGGDVSECTRFPGVCIKTVNGSMVDRCQVSDASESYYQELANCVSGAYVSGSFVAPYSPGSSLVEVADEEGVAGIIITYPDVLVNDILSISVNWDYSNCNASNGASYICPEMFPYCSNYYGICYVRVGEFCQFSDLTQNFYKTTTVNCTEAVNITPVELPTLPLPSVEPTPATSDFTPLPFDPIPGGTDDLDQVDNNVPAPSEQRGGCFMEGNNLISFNLGFFFMFLISSFFVIRKLLF